MKNWECLLAAFLGGLMLSFSEGFIIPLKHGYRLANGTSLTTLLSSSLLSCHEACLARRSCKSFQLQRRFDLCHLSYSDCTDPKTSLITAPGFVYSEKKNWTTTTMAKVCDDQCSISDTCNPSDTSNPCTKSECEPPLLIRDSNSEIRGSMRNIGARIAYVCTNHPHLYNTSVCMSNGTWSKVYMDCPKECGHLPILRNGHFVLDKTGDTRNYATASIQCNKGFHLTPKPGIKSTCLHAGIWEHTAGKCVPVDCGLPSVLHANYSLTIPNKTTYGASATMWCETCYTGTNVITRCEENGQWNITQFTCAPNTTANMSTTLATSLNSRNYKIVNCGDNKWWHYDLSKKIEYYPVTTKWQCDDDFCHFSVEPMADGSYKIKNIMTSVYLKDGNGAIPGGFLNGMKPPDEEHQHFMIYIEQYNMYSILSKATQKYVRVDETKYVTSLRNKTDCYAWYKFIPV